MNILKEIRSEKFCWIHYWGYNFFLYHVRTMEEWYNGMHWQLNIENMKLSPCMQLVDCISEHRYWFFYCIYFMLLATYMHVSIDTYGCHACKDNRSANVHARFTKVISIWKSSGFECIPFHYLICVRYTALSPHTVHTNTCTVNRVHVTRFWKISLIVTLKCIE